MFICKGCMATSYVYLQANLPSRITGLVEKQSSRCLLTTKFYGFWKKLSSKVDIGLIFKKWNIGVLIKSRGSFTG